MKVIVPMAGRGSRFRNAGEQTPKPLIPIHGKPMVYWAMRSIEDIPYSQLIFVALKAHEENYAVESLLKKLYGDDTVVILLDDVTEGQLCTVLAAEMYLDTQEDILIMSSDTFVKSTLGDDIVQKRSTCTGIISVANLPGDRWSFAKIDETGRVIEVAEKVRISDYASTGLYYFSNAQTFLREAKIIIANQEKTRGEYYVIPVYQKMIERGLRIDISLAHEVYDMGTPESLAQVLNILNRS